MMTVVEINSYNFGSTGNIMVEIANSARESGIRCVTSCPDARSMRRRPLADHIYIGTRLGRNLHLLLARLTGFNGCFSIVDTLLFLRKLDRIHPDLIHLHNLHNCYINLPLLFRYIAAKGIPVVWTLHDCWSFTGKCTYYAYVRCERWKRGCCNCPQLSDYPAACADTSAWMWGKKRRWFTQPKNMTLAVPSHWLEEQVKRSFMSHYPVRVIPNGIDLTVFRPGSGDFRATHHLQDKKIVLGVAFGWERRKGLDVFVRLSEELGSGYQIVLVGTDAGIDQTLPPCMISIHRTGDRRELAEIYSAADVFVNPTREEVLGMVNLEALACGTPVVTFQTGGSPECIDSTCGVSVPCGDFPDLLSEIIRICETEPYSAEACRKRALLFDQRDRYREYVQLYIEKTRGPGNE